MKTGVNYRVTFQPAKATTIHGDGDADVEASISSATVVAKDFEDLVGIFKELGREVTSVSKVGFAFVGDNL